MRTGPCVYEGGIEAELEWEMVAEEWFVFSFIAYTAEHLGDEKSSLKILCS